MIDAPLMPSDESSESTRPSGPRMMSQPKLRTTTLISSGDRMSTVTIPRMRARRLRHVQRDRKADDERDRGGGETHAERAHEDVEIERIEPEPDVVLERQDLDDPGEPAVVVEARQDEIAEGQHEEQTGRRAQRGAARSNGVAQRVRAAGTGSPGRSCGRPGGDSASGSSRPFRAYFFASISRDHSSFQSSSFSFILSRSILTSEFIFSGP